jgi:hypothetical protein
VLAVALASVCCWDLTSSPGGERPLLSATPAAKTVALRAKPSPAPAPRPRPALRFLVARVEPGRAVAYRARPGGRMLGRLSSTTPFGSPRLLHVARRRGAFVGVPAPERPNGRLAWIDARHGLSMRRTAISLQVDLSRRRLELRRGRRTVAHIHVGIGAPASPTPPGRYAITDKLPGARFSPTYGCCILAMSGNQPDPPPGWRGGTRLAIHGVPSAAPVGQASSAGCLRASNAHMRRLMRAVPLGAPVLVRR